MPPEPSKSNRSRIQRSLDGRSTGLSRRAAGLGALSALSLATKTSLLADDSPPDRATTQQAIDRGLASLAARQSDDGSFSGNRSSGLGRNVAVVSLAGLAYLSRGFLPDRGRYGRQVAGIVDYIAKSCEDETGLIIRRESVSRGAMYGHGFATLFLAEVYGTTTRRDIQPRLKRAIDLILRSQNAEGGWRYNPEPREADLSVTICQMMALRAARNAGVYVPADTIKSAIDYVRRCQNPDGGFMYQLTGGESRFPLTAGAVVALQNAGRYKGKEILDAYEFLKQHRDQNLSPQRNNYFFYAHYYSIQAYWQLGGQAWQQWYQRTRNIILGIQLDDGSWVDYTDRTYATAMACIILNTPWGHLPIFQR